MKGGAHGAARFAAVGIALAGCNGGGTAAPRDAGLAHDAATDDASVVVSVDAGADVQVPSCLGAAGADAAAICATTACIQNNWAEWPMPNSPGDVALGAPNPATYTVHGDGTVTEGVTGLTWQAAPPATPYTWADAASYCAGLTLAGHADWRVPTYVELVSLVDYSQRGPSIDPTAFPSTPTADEWTSTLFAPDTTTAWEVYFTAGDSSQDPVAGTNDVRCVRGPDGVLSPAVPPDRYAIAGGEVHDTKTGLTWQEDAPPGTFAWADAKAYCASLGDAGSGWRLPTVKELLTILDVTRATPPLLDCGAFPAARASEVWTATPIAGTPSYAWAIDFLLGYPTGADVATSLGARCVR